MLLLGYRFAFRQYVRSRFKLIYPQILRSISFILQSNGKENLMHKKARDRRFIIRFIAGASLDLGKEEGEAYAVLR